MYTLKNNLSNTLLRSLNEFPENPFEYRLKHSSGIGQKIIKSVVPVRNDTGSSIFNKSVVFEVPKHGYLAKLDLEINLTCSGDNTNVQDRLGTRVFKNILFETRQGPRTIQNIKPDYTNGRIDDLSYDLFNTIESSTNPSATFNANSITCFCPVFLSSGEMTSTYLDTENLEQLQLTCITNDSSGEMGLPSDTLTDWTFKLHCTYFISSFPNTQLNKTVLSYDSFHELPQVLTSGSVTTTVVIKCDKPVMNMHCVLRNTEQEYYTINSISLKSGGKDIISSLDRRVNYFPTGPTNNNVTGGLCYWFGLSKSRTHDPISMNLADMETTELTVNYTAVPDGTYSLYVFFEYWTVVTLFNGSVLRYG